MKLIMLTILNNFRKYRNSLFIAYKCRSTVPLPDLHMLNENCVVKQDFLYPLRKQAAAESPKPAAGECSLAGQPKVLPSAALQIREDIFEKWSQKPAKDIYKEMVKHIFTY